MKRILIACVLIAVMAWVMIATVQAQSGGGYGLTWSTIDNGGGESVGSGYMLNGTIGQTDAGLLNGNGYTLSGGFWIGQASQYHVYLPLVVK